MIADQWWQATVTVPRWVAALFLCFIMWSVIWIIYISIRDFIEDQRWDREHGESP